MSYEQANKMQNKQAGPPWHDVAGVSEMKKEQDVCTAELSGNKDRNESRMTDRMIKPNRIRRENIRGFGKTRKYTVMRTVRENLIEEKKKVKEGQH